MPTLFVNIRFQKTTKSSSKILEVSQTLAASGCWSLEELVDDWTCFSHDDDDDVIVDCELFEGASPWRDLLLFTHCW